jgi:hypothetical protein
MCLRIFIIAVILIVIAVVASIAACGVFLGAIFLGPGAGSGEFVDEAVPAIASRWDCQELIRRADDTLLQSESPAALQSFCNNFAERLGPMTRYDGIRSRNIRVNNNVTTGEFTTAIQCEKAAATVEMVITKRGDVWKISGIRVESSGAPAP